MALVKYNDRSLRNLTTAPAAATGNSPGALQHIKTLTASSSATLAFVDGSDSVVLDSTYPIYKFELINVHPETNNEHFEMNFTTDGTNFNVTKTSTTFWAYAFEGNASSVALEYWGTGDLSQSTDDQNITVNVGNGNDESASGQMYLFNPSSTTFVKHFMSDTSTYNGGDAIYNVHAAGYGNTTSAITGVRFKFDSGNIDSGKIKLYGIKDS